jgi:hypothetical protein
MSPVTLKLPTGTWVAYVVCAKVTAQARPVNHANFFIELPFVKNRNPTSIRGATAFLVEFRQWGAFMPLNFVFRHLGKLQNATCAIAIHGLGFDLDGGVGLLAWHPSPI